MSQYGYTKYKHSGVKVRLELNRGQKLRNDSGKYRVWIKGEDRDVPNGNDVVFYADNLEDAIASFKIEEVDFVTITANTKEDYIIKDKYDA